MRRRAILATALLLPLLAGCESRPAAPAAGGADAAATAQAKDPAAAADPLPYPTTLPEPRGLGVSGAPPVGHFLVPEGARSKGQKEEVTRFEIEATLDEVTEFYARRGYRVVYHPRGATIYPDDSEGILQALTQPNRKVKLLFIPRTSR